KYLLLLGLGIFIFWIVFKDLDREKFGDALRHLNYGWLFVAFCVSILSNWSRAARWNVLIRGIGRTVSIGNSFMAVMIGYFANLALPRMGEVTRCVILNRTDKIPVDKLIGTVVIERIVDLFCLVVIIFLNLIIEFQTIKSFFEDNIGNKLAESGAGRYLTTANILAAIGISLLLLILTLFIIRKYRDRKLFAKMSSIALGLLDG
ncbi:MAG: flippase-like domain-containing protein, partial [Bacteroidota bacterium]|nr:flippase-like domain-containing protein [Bacteroidota bacterium]